MPSATRARSGRSSSAPQAPKLGGGTVKLDSTAFGARFNMAVVHETVRAELAARRRGTASTKTRGQVSGGGAKPWRQKGTGRARAGSSRSPVWTGGGTVFGPTPRHYTFKINRKERQAALRSALSAHAQRESLVVFDATAFTEPSTAQAVTLLNDWNPAEPVLIVLGAEEAAAGKSFRNIARTEALPAEDVGVAEVVGAASLLISEAALPALVARAVGRQTEAPSQAAAKPRKTKAAVEEASVPAADASDSDSQAQAPDATAAEADAPAESTADEAVPTPGDEDAEA